MAQKFEHPPINELVVGVYFSKPLLGLRVEHIGLFWHGIREAFPVVSQQPPIIPQQGGIGAMSDLFLGAEEMYPLPRFWFTSKDGGLLLQLQRNALLLNWRKGDGAKYPHFDLVKAEFDRLYGLFSDFARASVGEDFTIEAAELTYINVVESGQYWFSAGDISVVIPSYRQLDVGLRGAEVSSSTQVTSWAVAKDISLSAKVQTATLTADSRPALIFELSAKGRLGSVTKTEADAWFNRAHNLTGEAFSALTSKEIQTREWKPRVEDV
jgi:uncharacterized protein (TIGR04255 family)